MSSLILCCRCCDEDDVAESRGTKRIRCREASVRTHARQGQPREGNLVEPCTIVAHLAGSSMHRCRSPCPRPMSSADGVALATALGPSAAALGGRVSEVRLE